MYIYDKLVASDSDNILVIGQPFSGKTFAACKYAIEKAYEGKRVYIFRDTQQQINFQGGLKEVFNRLKAAYETINGPYSGKVELRPLYNGESRGCLGDIHIYDCCSLYMKSPHMASICSPEQEVVLSYYKDIKHRYSKMIGRLGFGLIEATTRENVAGCKNNPSYIAMLEALSGEDYRDLMELPSHSEREATYVISEPNTEGFDTIIHNTIGGHTIGINLDGSVVIKSGKSRFEIDKGGVITINGIDVDKLSE